MQGHLNVDVKMKLFHTNCFPFIFSLFILRHPDNEVQIKKHFLYQSSCFAFVDVD